MGNIEHRTSNSEHRKGESRTTTSTKDEDDLKGHPKVVAEIPTHASVTEQVLEL